MNETEKPHPLLQKPLFIYSLPPELLNTLTLKGSSNDFIANTLDTATLREPEVTTSGAAGCVTCNISAFASVSEQRDHVRSDLHRFNLKRKLAGQSVATADEFEKMLQGTAKSLTKLI
jgi:hypothetical protein